ncbi:MAG: right-handed parallel beta-helix repeat-containing protein [Armatimonadota bacterium]
MNNKTIGGGPFGEQDGITGAHGWNNIGLLIRTYGTVKEVDSASPATWFKISDGSPEHIKVALPAGTMAPWVDQHVIVTGISSCELVGTELDRLVRARGSDDIQVVQIGHPASYPVFAGWNYIATPLAPFNSDPLDLLSATAEQLDSALSGWNSPVQSYLQWNAWEEPAGSSFGGMLLGDGYQYYVQTAYNIAYNGFPDALPAGYSKTDVVISLPGNQSSSVNGGWHMIGTPFNHDIPVDSGNNTGDLVYLTNGATVKTWGDAVNAGWCQSDFQGFDGSTQGGISITYDGFGDDTYLRAGRGYWFYTAKDNLALIIPADANDTTGPTVTVNQAAAQPDPTSSAPIHFVAVFSEPVTGFDGSDVIIGGTTGATTAVVTDTGDHMTYSIVVSDTTSPGGTVVVSVGAGSAQDASSNTNSASVSTDNEVSIAVPDDLWFEVIYVKPDSQLTPLDGSSWEHAFHTIQEAMDHAVVDYHYSRTDFIWVATGTYDGPIVFKPSVHLYGGFAGNGNERDWLANTTTIRNPSQIDPSVSVINIPTGGEYPSLIDGFTISNGNCGIYCDGSPVMVSHNNLSGCRGYAVACYDSSVTVVNNRIQNNYGGVLATNCLGVIASNVASGNSSKGIVCAGPSAPDIVNNTIVDSTMGVACVNCSPSVVNNILSENTTGVVCSRAFPKLSTNCVFGAATPYSPASIIDHHSDIPDDPKFVGLGDYHLQPDSPCVDTGTNFVVDGWCFSNDTGWDGQVRAYGAVDMGAYQYWPEPIIRNVTSTLTNGVYGIGQTIEIQVEFDQPVSLVGNVQLTLATGGSGHVLSCSQSGLSNILTFTYIVADGDNSCDLDCIGQNALSGTISNLGGVAANLELPIPAHFGSLSWNKDIIVQTTVSSSGPTYYVSPNGDNAANGTSPNTAFRTITGALNVASPGNEIRVAAGTYVELITLKAGVALKGGYSSTFEQRDPNAFETTVDGDQRGVVVTSPAGIQTDTIIDGFTICNGTDGVHCESSSPTISHNRIVRNVGYYDGFYYRFPRAGICCDNSSPYIFANAISNNYGDGIYCDNSSPTIVNCTIRGIVDLVLTGHAGRLGGGNSGIKCGGSSNPTIINNAIVGHEGALWGPQNIGGGIWLESCSATIRNNIIAYNGGGIYGGANPIIEKNCVYGNGTDSQGNPLDYYNVTADLSTNMSQPPLFVNYDQGDYHLQPGSLCIDAGTSQGAPDTDIEGRARPIDGDNDLTAKWDIGAYESVAPDTDAPTVVQVTSSKEDNTVSNPYGKDTVILIQVKFSEVVRVTGTPKLRLATSPGGTRQVEYAGGDNTDTLVFTYTVATGDDSLDLDYSAARALTLDGGATIKDSAGNNAVLALPAPGLANSLGGMKDLVIRTSGDLTNILYVKLGGSDNDADPDQGKSWAKPYATVTHALQVAGTGNRKEIWVAAGKYLERITLTAGVGLYGGFRGQEWRRDQRNWTTNKSVLDGQNNGTVVTCSNITSNQPTIDGFTITNGSTGGAVCEGASPTISNNTIVYNTGSYGGLYCAISYALICNNIVRFNTSLSSGAGGIYCWGGSPTIVNNTFVGNNTSYNSSDAWGGCYIQSGKFWNNIVAFNESGLKSTTYSSADIKNNCVYSNPIPAPDSANRDYKNLPTGANANGIVLDPHFVNLEYGDYRLQSGSPCIDRGLDSISSLPETDFYGHLRRMDGDGNPNNDAIDIGADESDGNAYESNPLVFFVDADVSVSGNGKTWETAFKKVQEAVDAASLEGGGEVWVKAGLYKERITLKANVNLYGGFASGQMQKSARDWKNSISVLDGERAGSVLSCTIEANPGPVIDGFTIQNGESKGYDSGGGICAYNASLRIVNNVIKNNWSPNSSGIGGGGIFCSGGFPTISNNIVDGNHALYHGGGICCNNSTALIADNTVTNNVVTDSSYGWGGGIYASTGVVRNNKVLHNIGVGRGGGVYSGGAIVENNVIAENTASTGAGLWVSGGSVRCNEITGNQGDGLHLHQFTGCADGNLIEGNNGVGIEVYWYGSAQIANNTIISNTNYGIWDSGSNSSVKLWNNIIAFNAGGVYRSSSPIELKNNCVYSNPVPLPDVNNRDYQGLSADATDIRLDPGFVNASAENFRIDIDSPCLDAGSNDISGRLSVDLDSQPRNADGDGDGTATVDIGAYEFSGAELDSSNYGKCGTIHAHWIDVAGTQSYSYAIGTSPNSDDVSNGWTDMAFNTTADIALGALALDVNSSYYVSVRAMNGSGETIWTGCKRFDVLDYSLKLETTPGTLTLPVNGDVVLRAALQLSNGDPVSDEFTASFAANPDTAVVISPANAVGTNGIAEVDVHNTCGQGPVVIDAIAVTECGDTVNATVTVNTSPDKLLLTRSPSGSLLLGGTAMITATVTDANDKPISGRQLHFGIVSGCGVLPDPAVAATDSDGNATIPVSELVPSNYNVVVRVTMTDDCGNAIDKTIYISVDSPSVNGFFAYSYPEAARPGESTCLYAVLKDAQPGMRVAFNLIKGNGTLSMPSVVTTRSDGSTPRITVSNLSTECTPGDDGNVVIEARLQDACGNTLLAKTVPIRINSEILGVSANTTAVAPGGSVDVKVEAKDLSGNPIVDRVVSFSMITGSATLPSAPPGGFKTDYTGRLAFSLSNIQGSGETAVIRATVVDPCGRLLSSDLRLKVTSARIMGLSAPKTAPAGEPAQVSARLTNVAGQGLSGQNITLKILSGPGSWSSSSQVSQVVKQTGSDGVASATLYTSCAASGVTTIEASAANVSPSPTAMVQISKSPLVITSDKRRCEEGDEVTYTIRYRGDTCTGVSGSRINLSVANGEFVAISNIASFSQVTGAITDATSGYCCTNSNGEVYARVIVGDGATESAVVRLTAATSGEPCDGDGGLMAAGESVEETSSEVVFGNPDEIVDIIFMLDFSGSLHYVGDIYTGFVPTPALCNLIDYIGENVPYYFMYGIKFCEYPYSSMVKTEEFGWCDQSDNEWMKSWIPGNAFGSGAENGLDCLMWFIPRLQCDRRFIVVATDEPWQVPSFYGVTIEEMLHRMKLDGDLVYLDSRTAGVGQWYLNNGLLADGRLGDNGAGCLDHDAEHPLGDFYYPKLREALASQQSRDVDIDVDSDNNNGFELPDESNAEDRIEGNSSKPGKVVNANDDDTDSDGIPDFADGFNFDNSSEGTIDDCIPGDTFAPLVIKVSEEMDLTSATIVFTYNASDPKMVTRTGTYPDYTYAPSESGHLRIWRKDASQDQNHHLNSDSIAESEYGDYVSTGDAIPASRLGLDNDNRRIVLYIEGIKPSSADGDQMVKVTVENDSKRASDSVRLTIKKTIPVDMDVDTNNTNGYEDYFTDDSALEDIEDDSVKPGKVISVSNGDQDDDGIPDFADGFDPMYMNLGNSGYDRMAALILRLPDGYDPSNTKVRFTYSASDPSALQPHEPSYYRNFVPPPGHLRIWRKRTDRNKTSLAISDSGDFIPSGVELDLSKLNPHEIAADGSTAVQLYIEGIAASEALGDQRIVMDMRDAEGSGSDAVRLTVYQLKTEASRNGVPISQIMAGAVGEDDVSINPHKCDIKAGIFPEDLRGIAELDSLFQGYVRFKCITADGVDHPAVFTTDNSRYSENGVQSGPCVFENMANFEASPVLTSSDLIGTYEVEAMFYSDTSYETTVGKVSLEQLAGLGTFSFEPQALALNSESNATVAFKLLQDNSQIPVPGHHMTFRVGEVFNSCGYPVTSETERALYGTIVAPESNVTDASGTITFEFHAGSQPGVVYFEAEDNDVHK